MKKADSMPAILAQSVGISGSNCKKLYQQLRRTDWGDTNTFERLSALTSVLFDAADVPKSPENLEFAKSIILGLAQRSEKPSQS